MPSCKDCKSESLEREEHHGERLFVCRNCGYSFVLENEGLCFQDYTSYQQNKSGHLNKCTTKSVNKTRTKLSGQPNGFIEKPLSSSRKECIHYLELAISKLKLSLKGSVAEEARNLLNNIKLSGHDFGKESLACACAFVALRSHRSGTTLKTVSEILGTNIFETNRIVKFLTKSGKFSVQVRSFPESDDLTKEVFQNCQFLSNDGYRDLNEIYLKRISNLSQVILRMPDTGIYLSKELLIGLGFMIYKSDHLKIRHRHNINHFSDYCNLNLKNYKQSQISKYLRSISKCIKRLVTELPFVSKSSDFKQHDALKYLKDIEEHSEMLLEKLLKSLQTIPSTNSKKIMTDSIMNNLDEDSTSIDDEEISRYIRTNKEVEMLKPLYNKFYESLNKEKIS